MCDTRGCKVTPANKHLVAAGGHLATTANGSEVMAGTAGQALSTARLEWQFGDQRRSVG